MSIPDELRNIRDHLRSGRFGQHEVWERQLEEAAAAVEQLTAERDYAVRDVTRGVEKLARMQVLLNEARGPDGHTHERVAEWLREQGYTVVREAHDEQD
jgi:hypothetical protein